VEAGWGRACACRDGRSILALGNEIEAGRVWRKSLRIAIETRGIPVVLKVLAGFASLQAKRGTMEHTLDLLLIILNHPASLQETKNELIVSALNWKRS
jgi:hypothetical protein